MTLEPVTDPVDWIKTQEAKRAYEYRQERAIQLRQEIGDYTLALANINEVLDTAILERENELRDLEALIDGGSSELAD